MQPRLVLLLSWVLELQVCTIFWNVWLIEVDPFFWVFCLFSGCSSLPAHPYTDWWLSSCVYCILSGASKVGMENEHWTGWAVGWLPVPHSVRASVCLFFSLSDECPVSDDFYLKSLACLSLSLGGLSSGLPHLMDFHHLLGCGAEEGLSTRVCFLINRNTEVQ